MAMVAQKVKTYNKNGELIGAAGIYSSLDDVQHKRYIKVYLNGVEHYVKFVGLDDERATPARIVYNSGMFALGTLAIPADRPISTTQDLVALTGHIYSENFGNQSDFFMGLDDGRPIDSFKETVKYCSDHPDSGETMCYVSEWAPWDRYPYNNVPFKLPNIKNAVIQGYIHQTNSGFHNHSWWDCRQRYSLYMNSTLISQYTHQNNPSECYPITTYFPAYHVSNINEGTHYFTLRIEVLDTGGYRQQIDIYNVNININGTRYYTEG